MDILEVCPFPYEDISGVAEHVRNISERLAQRHNVTVYATDPKSCFPRYKAISRVRVESFKCYAPNDAYFFSMQMLSRLQKDEFDIVHGHFYHAFPLHLATRVKCKRFIVTPHFHGVGHSPLRNCLIKISKPLGNRTFKRADKIVAVSEYEKSLILRHFRIDPSKVVVIPNGVDLNSFSDVKRHKHNFKSVLYVGCLRTYKGLHYLVEVLPKLENSTVLEIVGQGPLRRFLEKRAGELKVHDRVKFYENLPRKELLQKYADADVFVLLSTHEAYSLVVSEALTAGTPCIVAQTSALSEWVDNETCFGINLPVCINELARLIKEVAEKSLNRGFMKKWRGTKILDWNDVVHQLETTFLH